MIDLKNLEPGTVLQVIEEQGLQTYVMMNMIYPNILFDLDDIDVEVHVIELYPDAILEQGTAFLFMGYEDGVKDACLKERFVIFHNEQTIYGLPQDHQHLSRYIGRVTDEKRK